MKVVYLVAMIGCLPVSLRGQSAPAGPVTRAAATITEADVRRRVQIVADDSMGGRDTPSRGLDLTAQWVAGEFRRYGLKAASSSGDYLLPYKITTRRVEAAQSSVTFTGAGSTITLGSGSGAALAVPGGSGEFPVVLLGGGIDSVTTAQLKGKAVVWVADWKTGFPSTANQVLQAAFVGGAKLFVAVINDPGGFDQLAKQPPQGDPTVVGDGPREGLSVFFANEATVVAQVPEAATQFAQIRAATTPTVVPAPDWTATSVVRDTILSTSLAPNVAAIVEGTDPTLKNEYIVVSAHMDHVGSECKGSGPQDKICNGADDDGSGTVGIVELAEAFAQPGARPKRSVLFLGVSGEEKGLWGSAQFAKNPPVPIGSIVADLNIDMIGRNWKDTVVAIGMQHSDLGATLTKVAAAHPDLKMAAIDDRWPEENLYFRSDHYNFAVKGVPILFFTSGLHEDYHAVTDTPDKIDAEKEARILQLIFHLATTIGNTPDRPKWNPASYEKIVEKPAQVP